MSNILDPSAVLSHLESLLQKGSSLASPQDGLVALIHAIMNTISFRLVGLDDSGSITTYESNILPNEWNKYGPSNYTLRYKHEQSSLEFVVKVSKLGVRTLVNAIALESDKTASLDIKTEDYTSQSFFPYPIGQADVRPIVHGFISSNRVKDFIDMYRLKIVQKLVPGLRKEGYTENPETAESSSTQRTTPQSRLQTSREEIPPYIQPNAFEARRAGTNPLSIGRQDLDPIPMHPNPFIPGPLFAGPARGDGMFLGPNHPIFSDRFTPGRGEGIGRHGPWGGDGFLPPMGAPPGARFDPITPVNPPFGPGRPPTGSHDPDNDEFMPPGMGDMYM